MKRVHFIAVLLLLAIPGRHLCAQEMTAAEKEPFDQMRTAARQGNYRAVQKHHLAYLKAKAQPECERLQDGDKLWTWLEAKPRAYLQTELLYSVPRLGEYGPVLKTFHELWRQDAKACEMYADLTLAFAVVWSRPNSVRPTWDTERLKCKDAPPPPSLKESFAYYTANARKMAVTPRLYPWQLLVYVANNNAPLSDREWALANKGRLTTPYGKVYHQVPYDFAVLKAGETPKMAGKSYSLANLKQYGGVCAHQADYAQKFLRSLGIPAMYVRGESRFGGHHAWIGWFQPAGGRRACSYNFYGNYQIDKYYKGQIENPVTGDWDTMDRDIEIEVLALAQGLESYRLARVLHRAYLGLYRIPKPQRLKLLTDAVNTNAYYAPAWITLGKLCRESKLTEAEGLKLINFMLRKFVRYPDFTFRILEDFVHLLSPKDTRKINMLYSQAYAIYKRAQRPDLASTLKLAQGRFLEASGHPELACQAYAQGAREFPSEGRTLGKLAQAVARICRDQKKPKIGIRMLAPLIRKVPKYARERPVPIPNRAYITLALALQSLYEESGDTKTAEKMKELAAKVKEK